MVDHLRGTHEKRNVEKVPKGVLKEKFMTICVYVRKKVKREIENSNEALTNNRKKISKT